jgi:hypothetical protein
MELVRASKQQNKLTDKIVEGDIIPMKSLIGAFYCSAFSDIAGNSSRAIDCIS